MNECRFCEILNSEIENEDEDIVFENERFIVIIDKYRKPSTGLICLLIPKSHVGTILDLNIADSESLTQHIQKISISMQKAFHCKGIRIWTAINKEAGQSIQHFHVHIIPCQTNRDRILSTIPGVIDYMNRIFNFKKKPIDRHTRSKLANKLKAEIAAYK